MMTGTRVLIALVLFFLLELSPLTPAAEDPWLGYRFLLGQWIGEGSGQPGQGSGEFSFTLDLDGKILVRRNRADYPATGGRPAFSHQDLLVMYWDQTRKQPGAIYFDNEDHVIQYALSLSADNQTVTLVSDPSPNAPRYRLKYARRGVDRLFVSFEIAPPGRPDDFSTYLEGTARRK
jgi:hypothetical protein